MKTETITLTPLVADETPTEELPKFPVKREAVETETEIIVFGWPESEPEDAPLEWYDTAHNCDAMGCGWDHVLYRFRKEAR